jgi:papain like cysteine protease AvrRpt2
MKYAVPLIPQTTSMSCWAACIAMMLAWKNQASYDPQGIAANNGGVSYLPSFDNGLDPNDRYILERNGFELDYPKCYTLGAIQGIVDEHGPLWVASAAPAPHIRVVTGYSGQTLFINDPGPVNAGSQYPSSFTDFFGKMEALGFQELKQKAPVYVAWLAG